MRMDLSAQNKLGFIDNTIPQPDPVAHPEEFALWKCCNDMFLSWILNSIDVDLANIVIYTDSALDVWEYLK